MDIKQKINIKKYFFKIYILRVKSGFCGFANENRLIYLGVYINFRFN